MARHVHGVYEPAGDAAYARPDGEIVQDSPDFAFADTVIATEDDLPPPSMPPSMQRPLSVPPPRSSGRASASRPPPSYREQHTQQHDLAQLHAQQQQQLMMQHPAHFQGPGPGSVPPPSFAPQGQDPGLVTSVRGAFRRAKTTIDSSRGEMQELWSATESADPVVHHEPDPLVRLGRRIRTFWNFFEWDKEDVQRAAWIGVTVFIIVVCAVFVLH